MATLASLTFVLNAMAATLPSNTYEIENIATPPISAPKGQNIAKGEILSKIAGCESEGRQFNPDGSVLRGRENPHDIGRYQINDMHEKEAKALGYDIYTANGNSMFASWLYDQEGTAPWNASKKCWNK